MLIAIARIGQSKRRKIWIGMKVNLLNDNTYLRNNTQQNNIDPFTCSQVLATEVMECFRYMGDVMYMILYYFTHHHSWMNMWAQLKLFHDACGENMP